MIGSYWEQVYENEIGVVPIGRHRLLGIGDVAGRVDARIDHELMGQHILDGDLDEFMKGFIAEVHENLDAFEKRNRDALAEGRAFYVGDDGKNVKVTRAMHDSGQLVGKSIHLSESPV